MGTRYGKRIVTDGLVLCLDAADNISAPHNDLPVKRGCLMWLDGADDSVFTYSSGTSVSEWRDKSGNNNHVSNSNGTYQPSRNVTINSKSAVNFSDDSLQATNVFSSTATSYTKIAVVYQTSNTTGNVISSNTGHAFYFGGSTQIRLYHNGTFVTSSVSLANNTAGIISGTVQYNSSSSASGEVFVNGTSGGTGTTSTASIGSTAVQIGSFNGANYFTGYIAEVLVYDRVLSSDELTKVHNYLQNKWNIEVSDAKWYDRTANAYNATPTNSLTYSETNKGYFDFDGTNDYFVISNGMNSLAGTSNTTFAAWIYIDTVTSSWDGIIANKVNATEGIALLVSNTQKIFFQYDSTSGNYAIDGGSNIPTAQWTYVAATYDTSYGYKTYMNGSLNAQETDTGKSIVSSGDMNFNIGAQRSSGGNPGSYFPGKIARVEIYNKALSAAEILQNYNATKGRYL
jgi:hypothetical protein